VVFIAIFAMAVRYPASHDTWWHLRAGQLMVERGSLLTSDPFSLTQQGQPWINHGWLAQLAWYGLLTLTGWPGLALGLAGVITLAFWLVWQQNSENLYLKAFALILAAISSSIIWSVRPQMISFCLTALVAWLLHRFKREAKSLLPWLPLIVVVWVNVHGGYAIAFILLICYLVGEAFNRFTATQTEPEGISWAQWRHLLLTLIISLAVVWINPYTWQMWLYPFRTVGIGVLRDFIAEWQSPNFHQPILQPFLLLLLLLLAACARTRQRVDWTDLALVGGWTTLSFFAVRNVPIFALVCTPILVRYANRALEDQFGPLTLGRVRRLSPLAYGLNWLLLGLVLLGAVAQIGLTLSPQAMAQTERSQFPTEAVQYVQANPPAGNVFNSYNLGGYFLYQLWPTYQVFVDGRTDLYDDEFLRSYLATEAGLPGWQTYLTDHQIQWLFLERNSPLALTLKQQPDWQTLFEDEQVVIFSQVAP
jgi:hypothetical protein